MSTLFLVLTGSVGRRQFVSFDSAQTASSVLGCEGEELHTAVFKHHLRQLLQRATRGSRDRGVGSESEEGARHDQWQMCVCFLLLCQNVCRQKANDGPLTNQKDGWHVVDLT